MFACVRVHASHVLTLVLLPASTVSYFHLVHSSWLCHVMSPRQLTCQFDRMLQENVTFQGINRTNEWIKLIQINVESNVEHDKLHLFAEVLGSNEGLSESWSDQALRYHHEIILDIVILITEGPRKKFTFFVVLVYCLFIFKGKMKLNLCVSLILSTSFI